MLPTLGAPSKKSTPEQQMAMMRTYLNQLKDDTEGELYNIRWENLAKPLQDKLNGLDKDIVAQGEQFDYLNANMVSVGYLEANYLTAGQIAANYVATSVLEANYITANQIASNYATFNYLTTDYVYAGTIQASQIQSLTIAANQITSGTIAAARLDADAIASKFVSGNTSVFNTVNIGMGSTTSTRLRFQVGSGVYSNVWLKATSTPKEYQLMVTLP